jgi:hypothetical protein
MMELTIVPIPRISAPRLDGAFSHLRGALDTELSSDMAP